MNLCCCFLFSYLSYTFSNFIALLHLSDFMQLPLNFVHLGLLTGRVEVGFMGWVRMWLVWMCGNKFYWLAGRCGLGLLHMRVGMGTFSRFALCSRLLRMRRKLTPSPSLLLHTISPVDLGVPPLAPLFHWVFSMIPSTFTSPSHSSSGIFHLDSC